MTTTHDSITLATLDNGLRIAIEPNDSMRSVAMRLMIPSGVIHQEKNELGIVGICAELLLRGSTTRNSQQQADDFDLAGAVRDASPAAKSIGVSMTTLDNRFEEAVALVADMTLNPAMTDESFEASRIMAQHALASLADDPQQRAVLAARERHLPEPYNRSTYGTESSLKSITAQSTRDWWAAHAKPDGAILSIAGAIEPGKAIELASTYFGSWSGKAPPPKISTDAPRGYAHEEDDTNQVQIIIVNDAPPAAHANEMNELLAVSVLSGGMSGRLFTEVREKRALCYSVSASYRAAKEYGLVTSYVGTTPERAQESLDVLYEQLGAMQAGDVTSDELNRARIGLKSRVIFSGESTGARASALIGDLVNRGSPRTLGQVIEQIEAVDLESFNDYLRQRTLGKITIQTLGPAALTPPC
ncbi:MAG: insulinase family protein [Phycisphaerales bacterium]|nr:insulinase family protein [Phycisphaerales bacterium]